MRRQDRSKLIAIATTLTLVALAGLLAYWRNGLDNDAVAQSYR